MNILNRLRELVHLNDPRINELADRTSTLEREWVGAKEATDRALARERKLVLELSVKRTRARHGH